jgi:hypothetical protein
MEGAEAPEQQPDLDSLGQNISGLVEAVTSSDAPDNVKSAAADLMAAFQAFAEAAQGGGAPEGGATTPEQGGARGAVPASPAGPRG